MRLLKEKKYYIITFWISMIYRMIQIAGKYQMRLVQDDMGMLSSPAFFAGYDWSSSVATTKYYGIGYNIIFALVLRWVSDPRWIWGIIVSTNIILISLTCVLSYHIGIKFLLMKDGILTSVISVISSFVIISGQTLSQEPALFFLTWIIVLLLIKWSLSQKRELYLIAAGIMTLYAYLIHSRAIVFGVALIVFMFMYSIKNKEEEKRIKTVFFSLIIVFAVYLAGSFLKDHIIQMIWGEVEEIANSDVPINSSLLEVFSIKGIITCFDVFISNFAATSIRLFGINSIVLVLFIVITFCNWDNLTFKYYFSKQKIIIFSFSFLCFLIGIVGVSVIWGRSVVLTYLTDEAGYSYKGFGYYRYYATFFGPAVFVGLSEFITNEHIKQGIKLPSLCLQEVVYLYFCTIILKRIGNSEYVNSVRLEYIKFSGTGLDTINYKISIAFSIGMLIAFTFFMKRHKKQITGMILCIIIACLPYIRNVRSGIFTRPQLNTLADGGYELVQELEKYGEHFEKIYCTSATRSYRYQFHLKKYPIIIGYPESGEKAIIFSGNPNDLEGIDGNFRCVKLDKNEYMWTNDETIYEMTETWLEEKEYLGEK